MAIEINNVIWAAGSLGATGTAVWERGGVGACTGAGVYTLTLDQAIDATQCAVFVTPRGTAKVMPQVVQTSDTVKTVNMFDNANAALNSAFDWLVLAAPNG